MILPIFSSLPLFRMRSQTLFFFSSPHKVCAQFCCCCVCRLHNTRRKHRSFYFTWARVKSWGVKANAVRKCKGINSPCSHHTCRRMYVSSFETLCPFACMLFAKMFLPRSEFTSQEKGPKEIGFLDAHSLGIKIPRLFCPRCILNPLVFLYLLELLHIA